MKRLREKLHSESGASILLALLMFLVCGMVASSVLAAASSNAGKTRSNQAEHQKYLTLSSAIRLAADELERAEYTGQYNVYEWYETYTDYQTDAEGNTVTYSYTIDYFYCEQIEGTYTCGDLKDTANDLIPLGKELDAIFARQFTGSGYEALGPGNVETEQKTHTFTVTLPDDLPGYPDSDSGPEVYRVPKVVTVQAAMDHDTRHITLTAWLGDSPEPPADGSCTMTAELVAKNAPILDYSPGGRTAKKPTSGEIPTVKTAVGAPMKWELNWIGKGAA